MMMIVGIMHTRCKTNRFGLTKERMFTENNHSPSHVIFREKGGGVWVGMGGGERQMH